MVLWSQDTEKERKMEENVEGQNPSITVEPKKKKYSAI